VIGKNQNYKCVRQRLLLYHLRLMF